MPGPLLLSTAYFAPIHFYARYLHHSEVYLEQHENFMKQTYRNRCELLSGNGKVALVVPVVKGRGPKIPVKDIEISYDTEWQRNHWQTILSAYNSSPYFEYYQGEIEIYFRKKYRFLLDFNLKIHETICDFLEVENKLMLTEDFENVPKGTLNLRDTISPKVKETTDPGFHPKQYIQVFADRFEFIPNLSILDLLFNEGPNAYDVLLTSIQNSRGKNDEA